MTLLNPKIQVNFRWYKGGFKESMDTKTIHESIDNMFAYIRQERPGVKVIETHFYIYDERLKADCDIVYDNTDQCSYPIGFMWFTNKDE